MLIHLHIENFAIIKTCDLDFHTGMTVITGETGAGKSIILDALELALGARATKNTEAKTEIIASFDISQHKLLQEWLYDKNLYYDSDDNQTCLLRRSITPDGRSKSFINGQPVPLQLLRECGEYLIIIHGQHEHHSLTQRDAQRDLLDTFGKHDILCKTVHEHYTQWHELTQKLNTQKNQLHTRTSRLEFLNYQITEFENLGLKLEPEILANLEKTHKNISQSNHYLQNYQAILALLETVILPTITKIVNLLPSQTNLNTFFDTAQIQLTEASRELNQHIQDSETNHLDPEKVADIEKQLTKIHDLARKHRIKPDNLASLYRQLKQEQHDLLHINTELDSLEQELVIIHEKYLHSAQKLSISRQKTAVKMASLIQGHLTPLGMGGGKFEIRCQPHEHETAQGLEKIEFWVSANPGQPLQPLSKTASGGELSRISLAIQLIAAKTASLPTLIFDEVDVGIGGATAAIVGELLHQLSQTAQIICITHLAQVASKGQQHLHVHKAIINNHTHTELQYLNPEQKIQEIARMLGGIKITKHALAHARELMD